MQYKLSELEADPSIFKDYPPAAKNIFNNSIKNSAENVKNFVNFCNKCDMGTMDTLVNIYSGRPMQRIIYRCEKKSKNVNLILVMEITNDHRLNLAYKYFIKIYISDSLIDSFNSETFEDFKDSFNKWLIS